MGIGEDIEEPLYELNLYIAKLREKLWKEDKIKLNGYTFSEWVKEQENKRI